MVNKVLTQNKSKKSLCRFRHRFVFWASNLYDIVSIQVVKFHAGFQQPVETDGYFWGKYELIISYRQNDSEGEIRQKRFTRGLFYTVPFYLTGFESKEYGVASGYLENCVCEAGFSYQIAPFFLMLFPLLARIKYVPFKAVIYVHGMIREGTEERNEEEKCSTDGCRCIKEKENPETSNYGERRMTGDNYNQNINDVYSHYKVHKQNQPEKESADVLDLDLIALEKKNNPDYANNNESEQPQSHNLFYNMIMEHQENIHNPD